MDWETRPGPIPGWLGIPGCSGFATPETQTGEAELFRTTLFPEKENSMRPESILSHREFREIGVGSSLQSNQGGPNPNTVDAGESRSARPAI
jgi:hypothetical protein